jgi:hypothetical protein
MTAGLQNDYTDMMKQRRSGDWRDRGPKWFFTPTTRSTGCLLISEVSLPARYHLLGELFTFFKESGR